jgi:hypothetical protein
MMDDPGSVVLIVPCGGLAWACIGQACTAFSRAQKHHPLQNWESWLPINGRWLNYLIGTFLGLIGGLAYVTLSVLVLGTLFTVLSHFVLGKQPGAWPAPNLEVRIRSRPIASSPSHVWHFWPPALPWLITEKLSRPAAGYP